MGCWVAAFLTSALLTRTAVIPPQEDGGDIKFHGFDEDTGVVHLQMQASWLATIAHIDMS